MKIKRLPVSVLLLCNFLIANTGIAQIPLWKSKEFALYRDSIVQNIFAAKAGSSTELVSNYQSPANQYISPRLVFKFSLNGKDNEMTSGMDHQFVDLSISGYAETPVIVFGRQHIDSTPIPEGVFLAQNTKLRIRLDLRQVQSDMKEKGYYSTLRGDKIYKEDLKAVSSQATRLP